MSDTENITNLWAGGLLYVSLFLLFWGSMFQGLIAVDALVNHSLHKFFFAQEDGENMQKKLQNI